MTTATTATSFSGKIALITGASRGIGAALAKVMAAKGAHIILVARTSKDLEQVEEEIFANGGAATIAPMDLTEGQNIAKLAAAIQARWGKLDYLFLNAALLGELTPVVAIDGALFARVLTLNLTANQALLASFDPLLKASDKARVIGISSSVAKEPRPFWGAYGASKAGFEHLLNCYALENENISSVRIKIIDPGRTATRMRAAAFPGEDQNSLPTAETTANRIIAEID